MMLNTDRLWIVSQLTSALQHIMKRHQLVFDAVHID